MPIMRTLRLGTQLKEEGRKVLMLASRGFENDQKGPQGCLWVPQNQKLNELGFP